MHALGVNETKVTSRNAFIDNLFPLESGKESENDKTIHFSDYAQIFDLVDNPETTNTTYMWFLELL